MVSLGRSSADGLRIEILAITVVNLLPLVGVLALGWNAAVLVTLYWFELGVLCFWTFVRAIFAGRPSEFDGDPLFLGALERRPVVIPIPRTDVGIHLSTLPVLAVVAPVLGVTWFLVGVVTVGVLGGEVLNEEALATVSLAIVMVFLVDGGRTLLEYFYRGGYREHSAQTAIQGSSGAVWGSFSWDCSPRWSPSRPTPASRATNRSAVLIRRSVAWHCWPGSSS